MMKRWIWGFVIIGSLCSLQVGLLVGCTSIREARKAQETENIPPGERTVTAAEIGLTKDSILTLERALEIALKYHPSIVQVKQSLIVSEKLFSDAIAGYLPTVNASGSATKSTSNTSVSSARNKSDSSYSAGTSLSQLIYDFGETPASIKQAYENKLAAESDLKSTENNIVYNIKQSYYDLIKQQALVKVAEETVNQFQVHLEETRSLVKVGRRIKYDITKAEVDLGNAQIDLVNARNDLTTAWAVLNNTLGLAEEPGYTIKEPVFKESDNYNFLVVSRANLDELVKISNQNQPELVAQIARERAASAAVDKAIADLFPSLSLSGRYGWSGDDFPLVWNWSLSSILSLTIFNGFQNTNQIDRAVANLRSTRATRAKIEQQIYLDLTRAVAQLESAQERLKLTNLIVQQAEETLDLINERYKVGKASSIEVTDAQVALTKAQVDQIQARFDYQTAIALINKTIGIQVKEKVKE